MHRDGGTQGCNARSSAHLTVVHWPLHDGISGILYGCKFTVPNHNLKMLVASHKPDKRNDGKVYVKWKDCDDSQNTWENVQVEEGDRGVAAVIVEVFRTLKNLESRQNLQNHHSDDSASSSTYMYQFEG